MTDIKQVSDWALTIAAEAAGSKLHHYERMADDNRLAQSIEAHARAIEQHEAFRQEVSDAIDSSVLTPETEAHLSRFIIPKPDPLVEVLQEISGEGGYDNYDHYAYRLQSAIEARGGRIVWEGE